MISTPAGSRRQRAALGLLLQGGFDSTGSWRGYPQFTIFFFRLGGASSFPGEVLRIFPMETGLAIAFFYAVGKPGRDRQTHCCFRT